MSEQKAVSEHVAVSEQKAVSEENAMYEENAVSEHIAVSEEKAAAIADVTATCAEPRSRQSRISRRLPLLSPVVDLKSET